MRYQKWLKLKSILEKRKLTDEVWSIVSQLADYHLPYFEIDQLLDRLEQIIHTLNLGKSNLPIETTHRMLEIDHTLPEFIQLCRQFKIPLNDQSFFTKLGYNSMLDFFLEKEFRVVQENKLGKAQEVFWNLVEEASKSRRPSRRWNELTRPYVFYPDFMQELNSILDDSRLQLKKQNPNLTLEQMDQILFLGKSFFENFAKKGGEVPTVLPHHRIEPFVGIEIDPKNAYAEIEMFSNLLDLGMSSSQIVELAQRQKQKLFLSI